MSIAQGPNPKPEFGVQIVMTNEYLFGQLGEWLGLSRLVLVKIEDREEPDGLDTYIISPSQDLMDEALARRATNFD